MPRYATVYPLVTTRALARPFTYEAPDDVERGAVVSVRLGGAKQRGVVIELLAVCRRIDAKVLITWAVLSGLFLGFATELVIEAAH